MTKDFADSVSVPFGLGADIIEIQRFRALPLESSFYTNVFTENELVYCQSHSDPAPHLAAIFAGKEAVLKAVGSHFRLSISKIEILHKDDGQPYVVLDQAHDLEILVSLSHSASHAVAVALTYPSLNYADREIFRGLVSTAVREIQPEG